MSKVKRITVSNLKAISKLNATFDGCTAIITGGNNKGKTSFLRSLFDRVRGTKPEQVLKQGETEGFAECELTTGEKLKWEFNDKGKGFKEKLTYITEKDIRTPLTVELRRKFLPDTFDVDQFLQDPPAKQRKTLQALVGLDFTDVDARYKISYDDREAKNRRANEDRVIFTNAPTVDKVDSVDMDDLMLQKAAIRNKLNTLYLENKRKNEELRKAWNEECEVIREEVAAFNEKQNNIALLILKANGALSQLRLIGYEGDQVIAFIESLRSRYEPVKEYIRPPEPTYTEELPDDTDLKAIDEQIATASDANQKAQAYKNYEALRIKKDKSTVDAEDADKAVKKIEQERMDLIKSAKLPDGFSFTDDGIQYNNLSFTREQLSSSGIYIAALKLAAMTLGEVKTLHFDASFLDNISLGQIEEWAKSEGLQLLIEMPDRSGGEIEYQLLS